MPILNITYDASFGHCVPDDQIKKYVDSIIEFFNSSSEDIELTIGSELIISQFRLAVLTKKINSNQLKFIFANEIISVNEFGNLDKYPSGFCNLGNDIINQILLMQVSKGRETARRLADSLRISNH